MSNLQILKILRVLVVDDNNDDLGLLQFILEEHNVQVTAVTSAYEALNKITLFKPDIVISDIQMPVVDGYSLISKIRNLNQHGKTVPAIALTTNTSSEARNKAINAGFSTYLTKPFDSDELISVVSNLAVKHIALCGQNN
jgi:CheY-like chemotaxis protein